MSTAELKTETHKEKWDHCLEGIDRAVAWLREHHEQLPLGASIYSSAHLVGKPIINLGWFSKESKEEQMINKLFKGKTVGMRSSDSSNSFEFHDEALSLEFHWSIDKKRPPTEYQETVTL